jgi:hypothetical protein
VLPGLRQALEEWWRALWPALRDYEKRYFNGEDPDGMFWAFHIGQESYKTYEWARVHATMERPPLVSSRLRDGIRIPYGTISIQSNDVGRHFTSAAFDKIRRREMLLFDPDPLFNAVYPQVEGLLTAMTLPFASRTLLYNLRTASFQLDSRTHIAQLVTHPELDLEWRNSVWDDPFERPPVLIHRFRVPVLPAEARSDSSRIHESIREIGRDVLRAIAITVPGPVSLGPTVIQATGFLPSLGADWLDGDLPPRGGARTYISDDDVSGCISSWAALRSHRRQSRLTIAADRLASLRHRLEEGELVDVVTALEAAIGQDAQNELVRRLSLHVTRLVASDLAMTQRQLYDLLTKAFIRRARIMRGKRSSGADRRDDREIIVTTERAVRQLLQLMVSKDQRLYTDPLDILLSTP